MLTFTVNEGEDAAAGKEIHCEAVTVEKSEPLKLELEAFLASVATRSKPPVTGEDGLVALEVALGILERIEEHAARIRGQLTV